MINKIEDIPEECDLWLREAEGDSQEAAQFEFETAQTLVEGPALIQRKSSLIAKLDADPQQSFNVTQYSVYSSDRWVLEKPSHATERRISFKSDLAGGIELKKMLTYHLLPQFHPLGTLRSFVSTETYAHAFALLEKYLFIPNGLDATPESIKIVSAKLVNDALDICKSSSAPRNYFLLYFLIAFWHTLSANKLIPASHSLNVAIRLIDTKDRQVDIKNTVASEHKGWKPFSEDELSRLIEHALFWSEAVIPTLLDIKRFLAEQVKPENKHDYFVKAVRWAEFEAVLGKKIDGVTVCGYTHKQLATIVQSSNGTRHHYTTNHYRWKLHYKQALDKVRDAILIFVALITGLRKRELGILTFDDIVLKGNGEWVITVTRFKTSTDPNYFGASETLPLPTFIGELVSSYRQLRSFDDNMRGGLLFEQVANSRPTKLVDRSIARAMSNLGEEVDIVEIHPHRFRKTIAEILINRSERNIDLIRMLFGHRSYTMTLRYIARNPYLIHSIAETMETHYTEAFVDIVAAVRRGVYSGEAVEQIATTVLKRPELFKGTLLQITVFNYISYLLEAGEPIFIKRTGVGVYCVSAQAYSSKYLPPCLSKAQLTGESYIPNPKNCQLDCKNAVVLEAARASIEKNIAFYTRLLDQSSQTLKKPAKKEILLKISINEKHLNNLNERENVVQNDSTGLTGQS